MDAQVDGPYFKKAIVCIPILRSLPEWYGIKSVIIHYSTEIDILPTFLAFEAGRVIGFLSLKQHPPMQPKST